MVKQHQYIKKKEIFSKDKELPKLPGVYKFYDEKNNELISQDANLAYPIKDGIPIMLKEKARNIS